MYSSLSWLYRSGEAIVNYPDPEKGWRPFAVEAGERLLKNGDIEAMISSSSPVTSHIIAKDLKNKYQTPWLADLRDLWSQNHNYHYGPIRNFFDRRLELNTLKTADALVTVSSICADELRRLHRRDAYTITNGFDPDKINSRKIGLTSKFTVTYTGQIYTGKQDTSIFCKALRDLILDETVDPKDVEVRFYGPYNESLARDIEEYDLQDIINQHGIIPRDRSFQKQAESQVLLLFNWEQIRGEDDEKGVYPLKIFEYLAAQRPIIATGGSGGDVVERMLNETGAGMYAPSVEDAKGSLKGLYHEYKQTNKIRYTNNIKQIDKYSYRTMAKRFAEILDSLA
jgi:glycosyltransferase involved in cell wall biosynthesis